MLRRFFALFLLVLCILACDLANGIELSDAVQEEQNQPENNAWNDGEIDYGHDDEEIDEEEDEDDDFQIEHERIEEELSIGLLEELEYLGSKDSFGHTKDDNSPSVLVAQALFEGSGIQARLNSLFEKAQTTECRRKIAQHYGYFLAALGREEKLPFSRWDLEGSCPDNEVEVRRDWFEEADYIDDPADLKLLYAILAHIDPQSTIRLVEALYEPGHSFVIHVDAKEQSDETYRYLLDYAESFDYVHVVPDPYRIRVNWGGFSMVNATLQILKYSFGLIQAPNEPDQSEKAIDFHKVVHLSSTTYPIASNTEIRQEIAEYPLDANMVHVIEYRSPRKEWSYFVECDDAVHRIYNLDLPEHFQLYTSSQWWIISRPFAEYLATADVGSFAHQFIDYASHTVVADETYFGTVIKNTEFCKTLHHENSLFYMFGPWESELPVRHRDLRKCPMKDPDHCGRSPVLLELEDVPLMELNTNLFARKFGTAGKSDNLKDMVDMWRKESEQESAQPTRGRNVEFEGQGVLVVAKDTVNDAVPLCLGSSGSFVFLTTCFHERVLMESQRRIQQEKWWQTENTKVLTDDAPAMNRWDFGPCSTSNGILKHNPTTGSMLAMQRQKNDVGGPRCVLKLFDKPDECLDSWTSESDDDTSETRMEDCTTNPWHQLFSFGDGYTAPSDSLFITVPNHLVDEIEFGTDEYDENDEHEHKYICLGIGANVDEVDDEEESSKNTEATSNFDLLTATSGRNSSKAPLQNWIDRKITPVPCTDHGAVIRWLYVPFSGDGHSDSESRLNHQNNHNRHTAGYIGDLQQQIRVSNEAMS